MTTAYSNALLVAILPHITTFAKKLDLPIPRPITTSLVARSSPSDVKGFIADTIVLTNHYLFSYSRGAVDSFRCLDDNPFYEGDPARTWYHHEGKDNMATNQAIKLARSALRKLGYDPKLLHADGPPSSVQGPYTLPDGKHFPYCEIRWDCSETNAAGEITNSDSLEFQVNLNKRAIVGMDLSSQKIWRPSPKIVVVPELESDYRKRMQKQVQGKMVMPSNRPPPFRPQMENP